MDFSGWLFRPNNRTNPLQGKHQFASMTAPIHNEERSDSRPERTYWIRPSKKAVLRFRAGGKTEPPPQAACPWRVLKEMLQLSPDGEHDWAVLEFVTVGNDTIAFLSGSVKGGGRSAETSVRTTTILLTVFLNDFSHLFIKILLRPLMLVMRSFGELLRSLRESAFSSPRIDVFLPADSCFPECGIIRFL